MLLAPFFFMGKSNIKSGTHINRSLPSDRLINELGPLIAPLAVGTEKFFFRIARHGCLN